MVLVINMKIRKMNKKGQLFIIEAFIAVSVMIIMVTALYEVQLATQPSIVSEYNIEIYDTMIALDESGKLNEYLTAINSGSPSEINAIKELISQAIYGSLPDNGEFVLYCQNLQTEEILTNGWINEGNVAQGEITGLDYLIVSYDGIYSPHMINIQYWLIGV